MNSVITELYLTKVLTESSIPIVEGNTGNKILELIAICENSDVTYKDTLEQIKIEAAKLNRK